MSDRILDYWSIKLTNWAYYRLSGNGSAGVSSAYDGDWGISAPRQPTPLVGEALDTDDLVQKLGLDQRRALEAVYVWSTPETMIGRAAELGIHLSTLYERVRQAKYRLDEMDHARRRAMTRYVGTTAKYDNAMS